MRTASLDLLEQIHQHRIWHRVLLRIAALLTLATIALLFDAVGPNRHLIAWCLVGAIPIVASLPKVFPPTYWMLAQSCFDVVATVALIGLVPSVWTAGLVIVVASPAASAALIGQRAYLVIEVFGLVGLGTVAYLTDVEGWLIPTLVGLTLTLLVRSYVDVFLAHDQSAAAELDALTRSNPVIFWEIDADTDRFVSFSGHMRSILGYQPHDLPTHLVELIHPDDVDLARRPDRSESGADFVQVRARHADGHWVWLRLHVRLIASRTARGLRSVAFDITELVEMHEATQLRADTDELTGLRNRSALLAALHDILDLDEPVALFVVDLDRFKDVNDTLGHHHGDTYLTAIAQRLAASMDEHAVVARLGGDEFAVLTAITGMDHVERITETLTAVVSAPVEVSGLELAASASIGVAWAPEHGTTATDLLRRADLAMYRAKRSDGIHHYFDFETDEANVTKLKLSAQLEAAIDEGEMQLWYQPLVDLHTNEVKGLEGLVRWHHPAQGVLMPASFLDLVEISRHYRALSANVTMQAIDMIGELSSIGREVHVSVNISVRDLLDPTYVDALRSSLAASTIDPHLLMLELVEREVADEREDVANACKIVRSLGPRLAVDDFGIGQSSLLRLSRLPIDQLKIDRSFISAMSADQPDAQMITKTIIDLGRNLGLNVVAEGVETQTVASRLHTLGCDLAQGYLYTPALPSEQILDMLERDPALVTPISTARP